MISTMDTDGLFDSMRGLGIVVLADGTIERARGGFGGFLDLDVASLPGSNVLVHVPPTDADEFADLSDERGPGSLLYIDVDVFENINDRHGHAVGEAVLVTLARRFESACRSEDRIARIGGDEFVVLLPEADRRLAEQIAARIVEAIAEPLDLESGPGGVSISAGHAPLASDEPLELADHAMFRAERARRQIISSSDAR